MPEKKVYLTIAKAARIAVWALLAAALLFGKEFVAGHYLPCFWYEHFGWECSTCGASRAVVSLLSGDFSAAVEFNPVVTLGLVPVFIFLLLSALAVVVWNLFSKKRRLTPFEYCFAIFGGSFRRAEQEGSR